MKGGIGYGILVGASTAMFLSPYLQPTGSMLFFALIAVQLSVGAVVLWRRTGLAFATAAMAVGAGTGFLLFARAAGGHRFPVDGLPWVAALVVGLAASLLLLFIESRTHQAVWKQWRRHANQATTLDYLTFRHIPNLRDNSTGR